MPEYSVTWEITIEADSPREAAERALEIHRNPESIATVFTVTTAEDTWRIDLDEDEEDDESEIQKLTWKDLLLHRY